MLLSEWALPIRTHTVRNTGCQESAVIKIKRYITSGDQLNFEFIAHFGERLI